MLEKKKNVKVGRRNGMWERKFLFFFKYQFNSVAEQLIPII